VCQALRIITFSVTRLPGPSFHCRAGEPFATRPWPVHWSGHVVVDVQRAASKSCGDLIFSSHTTFMLTGALARSHADGHGMIPGWAAVSLQVVCCSPVLCE
jgi:sphingomyelin synthase-related protein 1